MVVSRLLTAQPMWRFLVVVSSVLKIVTVAFFYSRNGEFGKDKNGYLTNMQGMRITGYPVQNVDGKNVVQKGQHQRLSLFLPI